MGKTNTKSKEKYNKNAYARYSIRVRKESELNAEIEKFMNSKSHSLNYVITKLLCDYFEVQMPIPELDN